LQFVETLAPVVSQDTAPVDHFADREPGGPSQGEGQPGGHGTRTPDSHAGAPLLL